MRVAYICADAGVPVFGQKGASVHVQAIVGAMSRRGITVDVFASRLEGDPPGGWDGVRLHALPHLPQAERADRERAALDGNRAVLAALEEDGPFNLVYERYSLWSFAGMQYARAANIPGLLEVNAPLIEEQAEHRGLVDRASAEDVAARVFAWATALIAVSAGVASYLERFPEARGRVHVIANGVDPARFPPNLVPSWLAPPRSFTVGFVGTLKPWHGLPVLAQAFEWLCRRAPEARLLVVGDGPGRALLETDLAGRGVRSAAHFTGAVRPDEVPGMLAAMDVAVAPYPDNQPGYFSPLKVYEYMAASVPVVASAIGQLTDLIQDGSNGLLCPPGDAMALAIALERLRQDQGLREHLGRSGRETVLRGHTWDAVAAHILELAVVGVPERAGRAG